MIALHAVPVALRIKDIDQVLAQHSELQADRYCLIEDNAPKQYFFSTFIGRVILSGTRIVIPQVLSKRVVTLTHEGHEGVVKTKERLGTGGLLWIVMPGEDVQSVTGAGWLPRTLHLHHCRLHHYPTRNGKK